MARVTLHGHSTCTVETDDGIRIVIDPFFDDNPVRSAVARARDEILASGESFDF